MQKGGPGVGHRCGSIWVVSGRCGSDDGVGTHAWPGRHAGAPPTSLQGRSDGEGCRWQRRTEQSATTHPFQSKKTSIKPPAELCPCRPPTPSHSPAMKAPAVPRPHNPAPAPAPVSSAPLSPASDAPPPPAGWHGVGRLQAPWGPAGTDGTAWALHAQRMVGGEWCFVEPHPSPSLASREVAGHASTGGSGPCPHWR